MEHRGFEWARVAARGLVTGAAAAALQGACGWPTDAGAPRVVGVVSAERGDPPAAVVPDTVRAGVPFEIRVTTYGSGSCTRPDGAAVRIAGLLAEVTPYDRERTGATCTDDRRAYPRPATVRFAAPGLAVVRVLGRASPYSAARVTIDAPVVVVQ